jgi:hypothetical protein
MRPELEAVRFTIYKDQTKAHVERRPLSRLRNLRRKLISTSRKFISGDSTFPTSSIVASKISISGAARPTYCPFDRTGPGCDSPGHVQAERR